MTVMDVSRTIESLKDSPSAEQIDRATTELLQLHDADLKTRLQYTTTYLQNIIPVYTSLKPQLKLKVRRLFHTCLGVSNVLQQYKLTKNEVYFHFMKDLLMDQSLLVSVIESCRGNKTELSQVKSLFFGSKIFQNFEGKFHLDKYLQILSAQLVEASAKGLASPDYFISFLAIHPVEAKLEFFNTFLTQRSFAYLITAFSSMSGLQKRQFIQSYLLPYLAQYTNSGNMSAVASIMSSFQLGTTEEVLLKTVSELSNVDLQQAIAFIVKDKLKHTNRLLELWGNEAYIKDTPSQFQEHLTVLLLALINYFTKEEKYDVSRSKTFLTSITSRLSSNDIPVRNLGMTLAKKITDGEIQFDITDEIVVHKPQIAITSTIDFDQLRITDSFKNLSMSSKKETIQLQPDEQDSDDDEYSDNETESNPVFLKDLITRFSDDKLTSITTLLRHTITLVRQKASFKMEIEFYSDELISILAGLINKFEEPEFEELKLNAMVSVIVTNPLVISQVMNLLFTGDYSMQQRMLLLSSISLSARELRGFDDDFIEKPEFAFPTKEIPQRRKVEEIEPPKIQEIDEGAVGKGTVTRISSKLTKTESKTKPNNFAKVAPKFFYPLANAWIEGIDMGTHNEMFLKHYLSTMQLILQAAYPCYGFEDMAEVFTQIKENSSRITI